MTNGTYHREPGTAKDTNPLLSPAKKEMFRRILQQPENIIILPVLILLLVISFLSSGYFGGADNINHYFLSRYAFAYPNLFFDAWGRPLYTILASPFAQFGFYGIKVFNVLLGVLSAWLLMKTARLLNVNPPWMAFIILCFTPLYMIMLFTAMTEILFGFLLILSVCLFFSKRYIPAAIAISFIPFARTEGYMMIFIIFMALLLRRQWKALPFLAFGFIFFSLLGAIPYHDPFWIITNKPYPLHHPVYHTPGDFWKFFKNWKLTYGWPVAILILSGILMLLVDLIRGGKEKRIQVAEIVLLFLFPALVYYLFHSFLWARGLGGSLGLIRVLAGVIPVVSMVALYGFSIVNLLAGKRKWIGNIVYVLAGAIIITFCFGIFEFPVPLGKEEKMIRKAAIWMKKNLKPLPLVAYNDFNVPYFLNSDPYDPKECRQIWKSNTLNQLPMNSVYCWDAHFGPNECAMPLDSVMKNPYMMLIKFFRPNNGFTTLGGYPYEIYIFRKTWLARQSDNYYLTRKMMDDEDRDFSPVLKKVYDFEKPSGEYDARLISTNVSAGKKAYRMDGNTRFSPGLFLNCKDLPDTNGQIRIKASVMVYSDIPYAENQGSLVISLEDKKSSYFYQAVRFEKPGLVKGKWNQVSLNVDLPDIRSAEDMIKVYLWHRGKDEMIVDDLIIEVLTREKEKE